MKQYALSGFDTFRCIAEKCTDSCCVGWDVVIDDETAARYRRMDTPLGKKICGCMHIDEDGDTIFEAADGRCPFLRTDGLCEIQYTCGEEALSVTCARFPRIVQEYDDFTEYCLSLACPEAARILLTADKLHCPVPETENTALVFLADVRQRLIDLVQDRERPFGEALCRCLSFAEQVQNGTPPDRIVPELPDVPSALPDGLFRFHETLDIMTEPFHTILRSSCHKAPSDRTVLENAAVCFLYRYILQAIDDGDILSRVQQMLTAVTFIAFADADPVDAARLYSKEVEHSYENTELLYEAFYENELFYPEAFYGIWQA